MKVLEYSKQMQAVYKRIYEFDSVKSAGQNLMDNYQELRMKNSMRLIKKVAHNNEVINDLRSEMEKLNARCVQNQIVVQNELLKQIRKEKELKSIKSGIPLPDPDKEETVEGVFEDIMTSINDNFEFVKDQCKNLDQQRDFFKNEVFKEPTKK